MKFDYKKIIRDIIDDEEELSRELYNLDLGINANIGDEIDVNDYGICKITDKDSEVFATLVIEEDGSVRWYVNPNDRSDLAIRSERVLKVSDR